MIVIRSYSKNSFADQITMYVEGYFKKNVFTEGFQFYICFTFHQNDPYCYTLLLTILKPAVTTIIEVKFSAALLNEGLLKKAFKTVKGHLHLVPNNYLWKRM